MRWIPSVKKKKSIRYTIFASQISIIIVAVVSFFIISAAYFIVKTKNDTNSNMMHSVNTTSLNVYKYIREMENILYSVSYNTDIIDILSGNNELNIFERNKNTNNIKTDIQKMKYNCNFPINIVFYVCEPEKNIICDNFLFADAESISDREWIDPNKTAGNAFHYFSERDEETEYINIVNPLYDTYNFEHIVGYARVSAEMSIFRELLVNSSIKNSESLLLNSSGDIICDLSDRTLSEDEKAYIRAMDDSEINTVKMFNNKKYFIVKKTSDNDNFCIVTLQKTSDTYRAVYYLFIFLIIVLVFVCSVGFVVSQSISKSVVESLEVIMEAMENFKLGEINPVEIPEGLNNEATEMMKAYNHMVLYINDLIKYNNHYSEILKKYEFNLLQMQIKPHFLYNTLNIIQYLTNEKQTERAVQLIQALSKFYKISLHNNNDFVTIESEIKHIRYYVIIENFKYENAINMIIDIPDEIRGYSIPKITLQPLIENAVHHGILEKHNPVGTISVTAEKKGEYVYIYITDNGVGMTQEQIDKLMSGEIKSIGVSNTAKRLKMLFGNESGLKIESEQGKYTKISIKIKGVRLDD